MSGYCCWSFWYVWIASSNLPCCSKIRAIVSVAIGGALLERSGEKDEGSSDAGVDESDGSSWRI